MPSKTCTITYNHSRRGGRSYYTKETKQKHPKNTLKNALLKNSPTCFSFSNKNNAQSQTKNTSEKTHQPPIRDPWKKKKKHTHTHPTTASNGGVFLSSLTQNSSSCGFEVMAVSTLENLSLGAVVGCSFPPVKAVGFSNFC